MRSKSNWMQEMPGGGGIDHFSMPIVQSRVMSLGTSRRAARAAAATWRAVGPCTANTAQPLGSVRTQRRMRAT